jgi:hypothetical protein
MTFVEKIKTDDSKLARYSRAFVGWLFGALIQVATNDGDAMAKWTPKRWAIAFGIAALPGIMGLISVGQKNPTDAGTTKAVDRDLATAGQQLVVAPGPVIPASADPLSNPPAAP